MRTWVKGALAAFIGGAASSLTAVIVDPQHFVFEVGAAKRVGVVALVGGIIAVAGYLKQSPVPKEDGDYVTPPR